jgi:Zn-dependent peptidase ImmA (M78 family)
MFHEFTHILLHSSGLCDLYERNDGPPEEQYLEVFCNRVAGATLVPGKRLLSEDIVRRNNGPFWSDDQLRELSMRYSVSREVILRRLLDLGLTKEKFYESKHNQFMEEYKNIPKKSGFVPPATDVVSARGKFYVNLVITAHNSNRITTSDVSDYLGIRLKHLNKLSEAVRAYE